MGALTLDPQIFWRFAVVILLIGGIIALTWARTINNVRAVIQVSELNESYTRGKLTNMAKITQNRVKSETFATPTICSTNRPARVASRPMSITLCGRE